MWLLVIEIILFYCWPVLLALALWLAWKQIKKGLLKKLSLGMLVIQGIWIVLVIINGTFGK